MWYILDMSGVRRVGLCARNSFVETKSVFVTLNNDCCRRGGSGGDAIELKGKRYWLITHSLLRDVVVSRLIEPHCAPPFLNHETLWHQTNNDCWHYYYYYAKAPMKWSMCPSLAAEGGFPFRDSLTKIIGFAVLKHKRCKRKTDAFPRSESHAKFAFLNRRKSFQSG